MSKAAEGVVVELCKAYSYVIACELPSYQNRKWKWFSKDKKNYFSWLNLIYYDLLAVWSSNLYASIILSNYPIPLSDISMWRWWYNGEHSCLPLFDISLFIIPNIFFSCVFFIVFAHENISLHLYHFPTHFP